MVTDLAALFRNPLRIRVLAYILRTAAPATAGEVGKAIRAPRRWVEKELAAIARTGLAHPRPPRRAPHYQVDESYTLVPHLRTLLAEAMNPTDRDLMSTFRAVPGVLFLVATGVLTRDDRGAVDLLIVAKNPHSVSIPRAIVRAERLVGLPLRYSVMGPTEYFSRRQSFDRMLRDALDFSHRVLVMKLPQGADDPLG
jgi:hypothetical protein